MKPQNFLLENVKFATAEEFSKKRLEILAVEDFSLEAVDVGQKSELLTVVTAHLILATTHNICITFIFHPFPLKFVSL